jgi:hypothetical protein
MKKYIILISLSLSTLFANDKPQDAIQLIGADGVKNLVNEIEPDKELTWLFKDGILTVGEGHIVTSMPVNDFKAHIEFKVINAPTKNKKKKSNGGNSGVYIQQRYEVQILDSHGNDANYKKTDCASIYKFKTPDQIVCKPAGEWQSYDIEFHAAKWEGDKKIANARITLIHNDVKVHDNVEIPNQTGHGKKESPEALPLRLQDHNNPVQFRNFWLKELK